jgi:hypothetical protein
MIRKIRYFVVLILLSLLAFLSLASRPAAPYRQIVETPGPKVRAMLALQAQAGNSDGIVFLGILIFTFIAVPLLLRYRDTHLSK